jgi:uncharacterized alkaline shock family protein YloU
MSAPTTGRAAQENAGGTADETIAPRTGGQLVSERGKTAIADAVVAKIAGMATREMPGVYAMGMGMSRAFGAVRERIPGVGGPDVTRGVAVEVGERQTAVDLDVIVEYGVSIPDLASGIRRNVIDAVQTMCGLEVKEVNITVGDVHLPEEDAEEPKPARVQ